METVVNIWIVKGLLILTLMYLAYIDWRTFRLPDTVTIPLIILESALTGFQTYVLPIHSRHVLGHY